MIREHSGGHTYPDDPSQNRGSHFNDVHENHYDY
ncbi:HNH/endonuclease VII fold putative polymorphic toxin [Bacillus paramycoides]